MRRMLRASALALAGLAAVAGLAMTASPAAADTKPIEIVGNVNIRPDPNTNRSPLTVMPIGSHPDYVCYTHGQQVDNTDVWFLVRFAGVTGYYSSRWDNIPMSQMGNLEDNFGIHVCGTGAEMNQIPDTGATIDIGPAGPKPAYDREAAARWALDHATTNQPLTWSGCAYFAFMALHYGGGLSETPDWNDDGDGRSGIRRVLPGPMAATAAPEFEQYLVNIGWAERVTLGPDRFRSNAVPEARVGDVIAYDWDDDGGIDHISVVTSIAPGNYPNVAEWGTAKPGHRTIDYAERGWTYSEKHQTWLQSENVSPNVTAVLLRIAPWA